MTPQEIARKVRAEVFTWTSEEELAWLAEKASGKNCLEMGTYMGASAYAMLLGGAASVTCLDLFTVAGVEFTARRHLAQFGERARFLVGDIATSTMQLQSSRQHFNFIFIDNGHDYQSVARDIVCARLLGTPVGMVCGHDYEGAVELAVKAAYAPSIPGRGRGSIWIAP